MAGTGLLKIERSVLSLMLIFLLLMIALASKLYNELPAHIRTETKMARFKFYLKEWVSYNISYHQ